VVHLIKLFCKRPWFADYICVFLIIRDSVVIYRDTIQLYKAESYTSHVSQLDHD